MNNPSKQNRSTGSSQKTKSSKTSGSRKGLIRSSSQGRNIGGSLIVGGKREKVKKASTKTVRILDDDGVDVTPRPLYQAEPGDVTPTTFCLDDVFSSRHLLSSSTPSSQSTKTSHPPPVHAVEETVTMEHHMEQMLDGKAFELDENIYICIRETDTISLLDQPPTMVSEDDDDAEAVKQRNSHFAEVRETKLSSCKYVEQWTQTLNGALKTQSVQTEKAVMMDAGTMATVWDIYDSVHNTNETFGNDKAEYSKTTTSNSKGTQQRGESCSHGLEALSETFQQSLLIMERTVVVNICHPKLAAYRQLPILEDPYSTEKPRTKDQCEEDQKTYVRPTLERLWAFSCELTKGWIINCMTWNKKNLDILAVGYGKGDSRNPHAGLICCWTLKNPTCPERVFQCHSSVTSLDFSAAAPNQLGVGTRDGTVAIYNVCVQGSDTEACVVDSRNCPQKYLSPVSQVSWTKEETKLKGEVKAEALLSVCVDGRIKKWFFSSDGLDSRDLMELKKIPKKAKNKRFAENLSSVDLSVLRFWTSGLCFDFHPSDSSVYLIGTGEGHIHKCSVTNRDHYLETYRKHFAAVNHIDRSPFYPDVFLSCSFDWTIQLWKEKTLTPILGFFTSQRSVVTVKWSPHWPDVFASLNGQQVEIWDLKTNIRNPIIVHCAAPGVEFTSLLFARTTDCVLVGDSDGQVSVYQLKNLGVDTEQGSPLEDIIHSAVSE